MIFHVPLNLVQMIYYSTSGKIIDLKMSAIAIQNFFTTIVVYYYNEIRQQLKQKTAAKVSMVQCQSTLFNNSMALWNKRSNNFRVTKT